MYSSLSMSLSGKKTPRTHNFLKPTSSGSPDMPKCFQLILGFHFPKQQ